MSSATNSPDTSGDAPLHGLLAEYESPSSLIAASRAVRDAGFTKWDTYTPFPVHGIDKAMGIRMTVLPWIVLGAGLTGLATAILLQWWTNAHDYKWITSGKPFWSIPANVPIMFELTVLFSGLTALISMLVLNNLPLPSHPLDLVRRFARSTNDRFFLLIEAADPKFDEKATRALIDGTHPQAVEAVPEDRTTSSKLPPVLVYGSIILAVVAAVPFALAAKARYAKSEKPRIHVIGDMDWQPKYKAQRENPIFDDGRATRPSIEETVAVGELRDDDHFYRGKINGAFARTFPPEVSFDEATMARGRERFGIYCTPCHGFTGEGNGMVAERAAQLRERSDYQGSWVAPTNLTQDSIKAQPVGQLFDTVTHGIRNMPSYGAQIVPADRWAIILYLRALEKSRAASAADLDPAERANLK
jgi:mono/diheme cytochrome c family protein